MAIQLTKELYFTTTTVVDWVDVFTRPLYKQIVVESLMYCQKHKNLEIYAWVLMTNHLHMIVGVGSGELSDVLRDFKKFTSKKLVTAIMNNDKESRREWMTDRFWFRANNDKKVNEFKFWQDGNHVEQIYTTEFLAQKLSYIHLNPVRQEIVDRPEDYLYSSARNYAGERGIIDVELIRL